MKNRTATTIKIESTLYDDFKILGIRHKISLQNLVERCIYRYVKEEEFRKSINDFILPLFPESETTASFTIVSSSIAPQ